MKGIVLRRTGVSFGILAVALCAQGAAAQRGGDQTPAAAAQGPEVPKDLRPLLLPRRSEMRLVTLRYTQDRNLLGGNYAGGGGRGGGQAAGATAPVPVSLARIARLKRFDLSWTAALARIDAAKLTPEARLGLDSLKATIQRNQALSDSDVVAYNAYAPLVPFRESLVGLIEARIRLDDVHPQESARLLDQAARSIAAMRIQFNGALRASPDEARRAAGAVDALRANMQSWFGFYNNYDPLFTWWMGVPYADLTKAMTGYAAYLRDTVVVANQQSTLPARTAVAINAAPAPRFAEVPDLQEVLALPQDEMIDVTNLFTGRNGGRGGRGGGAAVRDAKFYLDWLTALKTLDFDRMTRNAQVDYLYIKKTAELGLARDGKSLPANNPRKADESGIVGVARGREGLIRDLQDEFINYTPEQLMVLADREFAWCEAEMLKASRALGFGNDWKAALEKVKTTYVEPGKQPGMIRDLVFEAIDYLRAKDLVTIPQVEAESQRMSMMSAQSQLANPFFLGGSEIQVSYPTNEMSYDARMQSMRGNNPNFSHATAFHEMIPGHNMTGYVNARFSGYRAGFPSTPFYTEGWALYWELTMYDKGFHATPEQKIGALFWRMHRCARIIFSLKFHMGQWSPQEAVDFLVEKVGHERDNAKAEVVRSFRGDYGPLYQAGYLLGGIQIRGLRKELVDSKQMTERQFHDEILRQGTMSINLLRLAMTKKPLTRDMNIDWDFYGPLPQQ